MIAKCSAILESVMNVLQSKNMDLFMVRKHISQNLDIIKKNCQKIENVSNELLKKKSYDIAKKVGIEFSVPQNVWKQTHRSNPSAETANE